jgi:hypothetical protein
VLTIRGYTSEGHLDSVNANLPKWQSHGGHLIIISQMSKPYDLSFYMSLITKKYGVRVSICKLEVPDKHVIPARFRVETFVFAFECHNRSTFDM